MQTHRDLSLELHRSAGELSNGIAPTATCLQAMRTAADRLLEQDARIGEATVLLRKLREAIRDHTTPLDANLAVEINTFFSRPSGAGKLRRAA